MYRDFESRKNVVFALAVPSAPACQVQSRDPPAAVADVQPKAGVRYNMVIAQTQLVDRLLSNTAIKRVWRQDKPKIGYCVIKSNMCARLNLRPHLMSEVRLQSFHFDG